ncbi:hypothetical protein PIB30_039173 [Stylosanthes scabra]|uniref:Uncharacterized protein n=1 Tax=Stylosanthes scabra TaxID=79078 RepID=A0ABU6WH55_9FABA|nr:hypothetical protein [Stylosanthes scabra]
MLKMPRTENATVVGGGDAQPEEKVIAGRHPLSATTISGTPHQIRRIKLEPHPIHYRRQPSASQWMRKKIPPEAKQGGAASS